MELGSGRIVGRAEWDFVVACVEALGAAAGVVAYIFLVEPLTTVLFEGRALRYKVQGYAVAITQMLLDRPFHRAFVMEVVGSEAVRADENAIVLSNHQGLLDYLVLLHLSKQVGIDQSCFFYVWKHCVRLPSLRTLWNEWQRYAGWVVPSQNLEEKLMLVLETPHRGEGGKWVVIFPEVAPWNSSDMLQHRTECTRRGCPPLSQLLYPRFPAFVQTAVLLRDLPIGAIYDVTIVYSNRRDGERPGIPTWLDVFLSYRDWRVRIEIRRVPMSAVPRQERRLVAWLEKLWRTKDERLREYMQAER